MSPTELMSPEAPDWFRVALNSIGDGVILTDAQGRVVFMNPIAETLTGWSQGDASGQPHESVFRIVAETSRLPVASPVAEVLARGVVVGLTGETLLIARNGSVCPIGDSAAPIRDREGGLAGAVLVFQDVSERRVVERAAADALAYAEAIVKTVPVPLVILDASLRVKTANRAFYRSFEVSPTDTEGRFFYDLGSRQWDVPQLRTLLDDVLPQNRQFTDLEMTGEFERSGSRIMRLSGRRLEQQEGRAGLILLAIEDITELHQAADALAASETRYRRLFEAAQDGILIVDAETGLIFDANPFLANLLGYSHGELVGKEVWQIGLFHDIEASKTAFQQLRATGYIRYEDLPLQTKDGRDIEVEFVSNLYQVGDHSVIQCNIRDITDRKKAEAALLEAHAQLENRVRERTAELAETNRLLKDEIAARQVAETSRQELLQRLATADEAQRRRIARELHDQMGQHLAALGLGLQSLQSAAPELSALQPRLEQLIELTGDLGREVHHLALELRPTALDDLGLYTALTNYAENWSVRSGAQVDFQHIPPEADRLPPEVETVLYRVVQEALTNVLKHAEAGHVSVILQRSHDQVSVVVEDDGRGFDPEALTGLSPTHPRLGLLGMRERIALVHGTLTVESAPGQGTTLFARIPVPAFVTEDGHV
jgi:PAS domain S-box-containing protein